jgi:hypothetical protein
MLDGLSAETKELSRQRFGIQGALLANLGARCRSGLVPKKA